MPQKNQNTKAKRQIVNHAFNGCRDVVMVPTAPGGGVSTTARNLTCDTNGNLNYQVVLCPLGLTAATLSSGTWAVGLPGNVTSPVLRGLYNKSLDFGMYRISRAKLVMTGNVGSTMTGTVVLAGYTDPSDVGSGTYIGNVAGPNAKAFDLAVTSTKEISVPIPVDSTWKRVSSTLTVPGGVVPYVGSASSVVLPVNTASSLSFGSISIVVSGATASTSLGFAYIDYDVEFKTPIDVSVNG